MSADVAAPQPDATVACGGTMSHAMAEDYRRHRGRACAAVKREGRFVTLSYREVEGRVARAALQLLHLGVAPCDRVAIVSRTRLDWMVAEQALCGIGAVVVPVYPTLTAAAMAELLAMCDARLAIVEGGIEAERVRAAAPGIRVVSFEPVAGASPWRGGEGDGPEDLDHPAIRARREAVRPTDLVSFLFTSGTTGTPKGVLYDHARAFGALHTFVENIGLRPDDVALSFLPMSHALGRGSAIAYFHHGVLNYFGQSLDTVAEDLRLARPTVAFTVPRVFEKAHERLLTAVRSGSAARQRIFGWAMAAARQAWRRRHEGKPVPAALSAQLAVADALVFRKVRARFGGRVRVLWSGGASLPAAIAETFALVGIQIRDVYGMSEFGLSHITPEGQIRFGSCGKPAPGYEARIAADGEILVRARHSMCGYHGMPEETAAFRDGEGWMHTGDIGRIDGDGHLFITDRKKSLLVLSNGKKVAPGPLEQKLVETCPYVAQAVVVGEGRHYLTALVHPNEELVTAHGVTAAGLQEALAAALAALNDGRASFETVKRIALLPAPLTQEAGELTPTLKVRRGEVMRRHAALIDGLYAEPTDR